MQSPSRFGLFSLAALLAVACGEAPPTEKTAPAATPAAAAPTASAAPAAGAAASGFGVPECDDYMAKYLACIDSKVPEAARAAVRQGVEQTKASWTQAAQTPQGKEGLAMACKQATEAAKAAMSAYGCTF